MKYDQLTITRQIQEIDLGGGRSAPCRVLSATEVSALRRVLPQPEAPLLLGPDGSPVLGEHSQAVRNEDDPVYAAASGRWYDRFRAATLAVAMGMETSEGKAWDRGEICDPAEGRYDAASGEKNRSAHTLAEARRLVYVRSACADILGDDKRDGLLSKHELDHAHEQLRAVDKGELIARSAEGNSGSASPAADADDQTHA